MACLKYYLSPEGQTRLKKLEDRVKKTHVRRIIFIGHSFSYFAAQIPYNFINSHDSIPVPSPLHAPRQRKDCVIYETDHFLRYVNPQHFCADTMFIVVTKLGSIQNLKVLEKLQTLKVDPNNIGCVASKPELEETLNPLSHFFPIKCSREKVAGSKTYVNTILTLYFLSRVFMEEAPIPHNVEDDIRQLIFEIKFYGQDWDYHVSSLNDFLGTDYNFLYFISKGASLSTAYQAALISKTNIRIFAEGINIGLFLHGPFQIVDENFRCILIIGDETNFDDTVRLIKLVSSQLGSGKVILINNSRQLSSLGRANENVWVFEHTTTNTYLAPIFEIIVLQFLVLDQALRRGVIE